MYRDKINNSKRVDIEELMFSEFIYCKNKIFFIGNVDNVLYEMDMDTKQVKYVHDKHDVRHETVAVMCGFAGGFAAVNPQGTVLTIYNDSGRQIKKEKIDCQSDFFYNIVAMSCHKENLYFFPKARKFILKYNVENGKTVKLHNLFESVLQGKTENEELIKCATKQDDIVWLITSDGYLVSFDMETDRYVTYALPIDAMACRCMQWNGENLYFLLNSNKIYSWKKNAKKAECIWDAGEYLNKEGYFNFLQVCSNTIVLLPCFGDDVVLVDKISGEAHRYNGYPEDFKYICNSKQSKYGMGHEIFGSNIHPLRENYLMSIDAEAGIGWIKPTSPLLQEKYRYYTQRRMAFTESKTEDLLLLCNINKYKEEKN